MGTHQEASNVEQMVNYFAVSMALSNWDGFGTITSLTTTFTAPANGRWFRGMKIRPGASQWAPAGSSSTCRSPSDGR